MADKSLLDSENFNWTDDPVTGMILTQAEKDSYGNKIDPMVYYYVGKHKVTGMLAIVPTQRRMNVEFANDILKRQNRFS
jgi:hypothetical protein